jgi:hypothetical protein
MTHFAVPTKAKTPGSFRQANGPRVVVVVVGLL